MLKCTIILTPTCCISVSTYSGQSIPFYSPDTKQLPSLPPLFELKTNFDLLFFSKNCKLNTRNTLYCKPECLTSPRKSHFTTSYRIPVSYLPHIMPVMCSTSLHSCMKLRPAGCSQNTRKLPLICNARWCHGNHVLTAARLVLRLIIQNT